jgi:hypothetical protein
MLTKINSVNKVLIKIDLKNVASKTSSPLFHNLKTTFFCQGSILLLAYQANKLSINDNNGTWYKWQFLMVPLNFTSNINPFIPSKAIQCHEAKVENMANKVKK